MFKKVCIILSFFLATTLLWILNSSTVFGKDVISNEVYSSTSVGEILKVNKWTYPFYPFKSGESAVLDDSFDYLTLLNELNAKIVFTEQTDNGYSIYAYSKKIKYKTYLSGKKVNLHIHIGEKNVKIGSPIIYGSF